MGEYYAVYQSGAELLGVGLTSTEALQDAERWEGSDALPPHVLRTGRAARGNARGLLSPPVYTGTLCGRAGRGQEHPVCGE